MIFCIVKQASLGQDQGKQACCFAVHIIWLGRSETLEIYKRDIDNKKALILAPCRAASLYH
jgi:hypothetical protein